MATKSYEASAPIDADAEQVWAVLADGASWPSWDSGVDRFDGVIEAGGKVRVHTGGRGFPVRVTGFAPPTRIEFSGGMPLGLFRGVRTYTVTPSGSGVEFRMREEYSGPLLPLVWKSMPDLQPGFDRFAAGLKERVERGAG